MQPDSGQQLGKHVPAATNTHARVKEVFSVWSVPRSYNQNSWSIVQLNSVREAVKIGPERGKLKNLHC
jgi:hypothetical protein